MIAVDCSLLTPTTGAGRIQPAGNKSAGISTPFRYGAKRHSLAVVFLCAAFCRAYPAMAGLFGQSLRLAAPYRGSTNSLNPVAQSLVPFGGGYSSLDMESPAYE